MSKTIEQKVVEMRFDNSNFEKNVSQSMDTLNKLQATIDKTSSGNAFAGLSKAVDNLNFGSVTTAIQTVTEKFSVWEEIAIGAARNIGAALSNYVVKGLNDMVFKNVSAGWDKYAQKTEAVQTIMASIADQDFGNVDKMEYVEGLMEKLNWFTDETSFHLTDMISSIGKFTSAGVGLDDAANAMMGIANWAAVSGANANTASRVMYQLSQSLGLGSVRTQDWMSVETANMATKEFKELAIQVAKAKGTLDSYNKTVSGGHEVSYQNFRENLKDGWLTSEVLTETLAQYSGYSNALNRIYDAYGGNVPTSKLIKTFEEVRKEAKDTGKTVEQVFKSRGIEVDFSVYDQQGKVIGNLSDKITELGARAFKAAQEAKTFNEAIGSVGDAASTVWMRVYEGIFGNYEEAKELWTNLANDLYDLFVEPIWSVSEAIDEWKKLGGRGLLFGRTTVMNGDEEEIVPTGAFDIFLSTIVDVSTALREGIGVSAEELGAKLVKLSQKVLNAAKWFKNWVGPVEDLTKKFERFFGFFKDIIGSIDIFNQKSEDSLDIVGLIKYRFQDAFTRVENIAQRVSSIIGYLKEGLIAFFNALKFNGTSLQNFGDTAQYLGEVGNDLAKALSPITLIFKRMGEFGKKAGTLISNLLGVLSSVPMNIVNILKNTNLLSWGADALNETLKAVREGFGEAFDSAVFADIHEMFKYVWSSIKTFIDGFTSNFNVYDKIKTIAKGIASAINLVGRAIQFLLTPFKVLDGMGVFTEIGKFLSGTVIDALLSIPAAIAKIVSNIDNFIKQHYRVQEIWEGLITIFSSIIKFLVTSANAISDFIKSAQPLSKVGNLVKNMFASFKESEMLTSIGDKVSNAFDKVVKFFNEDFHLDNFKLKVEEIKTSIKDFVNESELLLNVKTWFNNLFDSAKKFINVSQFISNIKTSLAELWANIKALFSKENNFTGFGANFMSGFAKGMLDSVNTAIDAIKKIGQKVLDAIKEFFGIHSPSTVMEEIGEDLVDGFTNGIKDNIKKPVDAIKSLAGAAFAGLTALLNGGSSEGTDKAEQEVKENVESSNNIKKGFGVFAKNLLGIGAIALPTVAAVKISNIFRTFMSPFEALENVTDALAWKAKGEVIVKGITALGTSLKQILLALGGLVLMFAGAAVIIAFADKYARDENGKGGIAGPITALITMIGEVLGLVGVLIKTVGKVGSAVNGSPDLKNKKAKFELFKNETTEYIKAIGEIFVQLGAGMLLLASSVAVLAIVSKQVGGDNLANAFGIIMAFLASLGLAAYLIAQFSTGETKTGLKINSKGLNLQHSGYTEGFYAIGTFMLEVGTAMAAMALAAAIVIKASGGDINVMHAAFDGIMSIMSIIMVAIVGIVYVSNKLPQNNLNRASDTIKWAGVSIASMAVSLRLIAKTVIMLGKEDPGKIKQGVKVVAELGLVLFAFAALAVAAKPSTMKNAGKIGQMMLAMSGALVIMSVAVKSLGEMDATKLGQGMRALTSFMMFFGVVSAVALLAASVNASDQKFGSIGFMLMELAAAFVIIAKALTILDSVKNMGKAIVGLLGSFVAIGALFGVIAGVSSIEKVKPGEFASMAGSLILISGSFVVMAKALEMMGGNFDMGQAIGGLVSTFIALGLLFAVVSGMAVLNEGKGGEILKSAAGLALVAVSMSVLMKMIADAGTVLSQNEDALKNGVIALAAVVGAMTILGALAYVTGPAMLMFGAGIAALGVGLLAVSTSFFVFYQTLVLLGAEASVFGGAISDMIEAFLDKFIALGPKLSASIAMIFKAVANGIADSVVEIVNAVVRIIEEVAKNIDKILTILGPMMDKVIVFIVYKISLLITLIQPLVDGIINHIVFLFNSVLVPGVLLGLDLIVNWILTTIPLIANTIVSTVETIVTRLLELVGMLVNSDKGILAIISTALMGENGILTIIDTFIHKLLENIRNLTTDLIDTLLYVLQELVNGMIEHMDIVLTGIEEAINMIVAHIVSLTDTILKGVVDVIEGLATAINNHGSDVWAAIWHVAEAIWNSFWGIFNGDGENSIGKLASNIMEGLGEGIKNFVGKVTSKISEVASTVVEKFKSVFGIASPSKVMAELGGFLDQGLANGIANNVNLPIGSISNLGDGIIGSLKSEFLGDDVSDITGLFGNNIANGLSDALGGITDVLDTDDFTPTITPVLDLSKIQNGAGQIPGMLNSGTGYTIDTTAVNRSAYNPYEYYDGTVKVSSDEAQLSYFEALKNKMDEVVNKFGSAKVVLDTGAVVGGIVDPMDMALGQRMAQVGRGVIAATK